MDGQPSFLCLLYPVTSALISPTHFSLFHLLSLSTTLYMHLFICCQCPALVLKFWEGRHFFCLVYLQEARPRIVPGKEQSFHNSIKTWRSGGSNNLSQPDYPVNREENQDSDTGRHHSKYRSHQYAQSLPIFPNDWSLSLTLTEGSPMFFHPAPWGHDQYNSRNRWRVKSTPTAKNTVQDSAEEGTF